MTIEPGRTVRFKHRPDSEIVVVAVHEGKAWIKWSSGSLGTASLHELEAVDRRKGGDRRAVNREGDA